MLVNLALPFVRLLGNYGLNDALGFFPLWTTSIIPQIRSRECIAESSVNNYFQIFKHLIDSMTMIAKAVGIY